MALWKIPAALFVATVVLTPGMALGRGGFGGGGRARPTGRPAARPSMPSLGAARAPGINRGGGGTSFGNRAPSRPAPRGNLPKGGFKPSALPGNATAKRPQGGRPATRPSTRPATRPSAPSLGFDHSGRPSIDRPRLPGGDRPRLPGGAPSNMGRPDMATRPSPQDLGDFLGMDGSVRPDQRPTVRPEQRPEQRPAVRPSNRRPEISQGPEFGRPGLGERPIEIGQINLGNNNVVNRPTTWARIDQNQVANIQNRWQGQLGGMQQWHDRHPDRLDARRNWGNDIRYHWRYQYHTCFGPQWWGGHRHYWCGWHYGYSFNRYPWNYWWRAPTYNSCVRWFSWTANPAVWSQPVYYDYGQGGNVVYQDNSVLINGENVATADQFAESAMDLATVAPPSDEDEAANADWMPLGTFAVSVGEQDVDPTRMIQLAVDKQGVISGTVFNTNTDDAQSVQGQIDKQTQRAAFRIGESQNIVVETGLYNLTQDEVPVLVHFGTETVENWLLVRLSQESEPNESSK